MDSQLDNTIEKMNTLKNKYPNIINVWENYINIKKKLLQESLTQFNHVYQTLNSSENNDLSNKQIYLLYLLSNGTAANLANCACGADDVEDLNVL